MFKFVRSHSQPIGDHPLNDTLFLAHSMEIQSFTTDRGSPTLAMSIAGSNLSATHMAIRIFSARLGGELVFHKAEVPGCDVLHLLFGQSLPDAQLSSLQGCVASILDVYFYICFDYLLFHLQ